MEMTRRNFIAMAAGGPALLSLGQSSSTDRSSDQSPSNADITVDSLCYFTYTRDWKAESISTALQDASRGGIGAIVLDGIYPREFAGAVDRFADWEDFFARPDAPALPILKAVDFNEAKRLHKLGIVLACQDASILGPPLRAISHLEMFYSLGLRVLQLTHNARTPWADSCLENRDAGLSRAGEALIPVMNRLGIVIDLSHCSRQTLLDVLPISSKPCAVTHAGCKALAPTARNKSDEEIRALGGAGGFFGVFNQLNWLTDKPGGNLNTILAHIDHAVQLIGPTQVGFGSDGYINQLDATAELKDMQEYQRRGAGHPTLEWPWDAIRVPELNSPNRLHVLADGLAARGFKDPDIRGIVGGNFIRLFRNVCG
jgi:membrane dipeptidase